MIRPYSIYCHIPFCTRRCGYCDFTSYAGLEELIPAYRRALMREFEQLAEAAGFQIPVHTIYFGGGTPSLLAVTDYEAILHALLLLFCVTIDCEISLEANPGTVNKSYLADLRRLGINRLSLGAQSAQENELRLLERQHTWSEVRQIVEWSRQAGFENVNLDFIYGLPGQSLESWEGTLREAIILRPEHLSLYSLTLEPGTRLLGKVKRGLYPTPDPDVAADMYESASNLFEKAGYIQYEISNWAVSPGAKPLSPVSNPSYACRHNLQYWQNDPYLGFGAGAHGFPGKERTANIRSAKVYVERCLDGQVRTFPRTPATVKVTAIDQKTEIAETMMLGLRLTRQGVSDQAFYDRFSLHLAEYFDRPITKFTTNGLLEWLDGHLRLTKRGRLLGNQVFVEFI